ncbi:MULTISPECIES: DUF305 domain-containing protein [Mycolicibacterium]|nr:MULTISPECIES: DUF305 domain-containing protein [Mycolicibacterium]
MRDDPRTVTGRPVRAAWAVLAGVAMIVVAGCGDGDRVSSPGPSSAAVAITEQAHTRFDVLFARDIIDHSAQAVALSNQTIGKQGVPTEISDIARRISANSTTHVNELQALLLDWGFAPMTVGSRPPAAAPSVAVGPGEHPLAVDADVGRLINATGVGAAGVYLELMIRQHRFTISVARDELQSGSNPGAIAIARSLIESQQFEISVMETLRR